MTGLLDGLAAAHAGGIVHRDLKPSNVLVDGHGRARVMDFGIAARVQDDGAQATQRPIVGTPGYMSPEAIRGEAPTPAMDVFAAGLVLIELLTGRKLVAERDVERALQRIEHEDLVLPDELPPAVDDALRAILRQAIARRPAERTASAAALAAALRGWLAPPAGHGGDPGRGSAPGDGAAGHSGTLDFLLRRMRHRSDFPALSDSVARILRIATSESESLGRLADEILLDVALTNKLLRLVNTAQFTHAGGGTISTVSRAVALVGFAGIRNMALSLVLLEHMHDKGHADRLKEEFLRALMAGALADELCRGARDGRHGRDSEEAFLGAMLQNLGRLLTEYYFAEEAQQIRNLAAAGLPHAVSAASPAVVSPAVVAQAETAASISVLGLSFEELGLGIARSWGLPENLQRCMRRPDGEPPPAVPAKPIERLRWTTRAANELTDVLLRSDGDPRAALAAVAERLSRTLGMSVREIEAATASARQRLAQLAQAMHLHIGSGTPARRLLAAAADEPTRAEARPASAAQREQAVDTLSAGVAEITQAMVESFKLNEVLRMVLETMLRALGFRRVVFCLRDAKTAQLTGRFGLGDMADGVAAQFKVAAGGGSDLFAAVCAKGADTLISDAAVPTIAARLPAWYRSGINAPAFLLLPLMMKGAPFALIYADKAQAGSIELGEKELQLLRTLRNQAVMAFKQAA